MISQELYDETLLENEEVFELSPEDAVKETTEQFERQFDDNCQNKNTSVFAPTWNCSIVTEHPSTEYGRLERERRTKFQQHWIDLSTEENDLDSCRSILKFLSEDIPTIESLCSYLFLMHQKDGMALLQKCWIRHEDNQAQNDDDVVLTVLKTLVTIYRAIAQAYPANPAMLSSLRRQFQASFYCYQSWKECGSQYLENNRNDSEKILVLLQLGIYLCRRCEDNKVSLAKHGNIIPLLHLLLLKNKDESHPDGNTQYPYKIKLYACQLLAVLCRYDDTNAKSSCANDVSMDFHKQGTVLSLIQITKQQITLLLSSSKNQFEKENSNSSLLLLGAALTALRSLAIHDDIVQSMVACGILPLIEQVLSLQQLRQETKNDSDQKNENDADDNETSSLYLPTNVMGLMRNLCANDDIKTTFCLNSIVIEGMVFILKKNIMNQNCDTNNHKQKLLEHGCGTIAAMALRKPQNAKVLVDYDVPNVILRSMEQYPNNVPLQRQGALAIRNIVARLKTTTVPQLFLDLGAEHILRNIAGQHQGSVDESYAALRDLGCTVSMIKMKEDGTITRGTEMFGEVKSNFRREYDNNNVKIMQDRIDQHVASLS